jgi:hypothetical protein
MIKYVHPPSPGPASIRVGRKMPVFYRTDKWNDKHIEGFHNHLLPNSETRLTNLNEMAKFTQVRQQYLLQNK